MSIVIKYNTNKKNHLILFLRIVKRTLKLYIVMSGWLEPINHFLDDQALTVICFGYYIIKMYPPPTHTQFALKYV